MIPAEYWADYDRRHPTPTSEEWLREIASNGGLMAVDLRTQHCPDCSSSGELDPKDIANVLAQLDEAREALAAYRANLREKVEGLPHYTTYRGGEGSVADRYFLGIDRDAVLALIDEPG